MTLCRTHLHYALIPVYKLCVLCTTYVCIHMCTRLPLVLCMECAYTMPLASVEPGRTGPSDFYTFYYFDVYEFKSLNYVFIIVCNMCALCICLCV